MRIAKPEKRVILPFVIFNSINVQIVIQHVLKSGKKSVAVGLVYLKYPKEKKFAVLVLSLIIAKLIWENTFGQTSAAQLIGSPVLTEAHLVGAIGGLLCGLGYLFFRRLQREHIS